MFGEECDLGVLNGQICDPIYGGDCDWCNSECETEKEEGPYCGDGVVQEEFEQCDDGNNQWGDGCSPNCKKEGIYIEKFPPIVWQCDERLMLDDATSFGRISRDGDFLIERINNYAFEGEQIQWTVLVMDKNGVEKIKDVYVTLDGQIQANCKETPDYSRTVQESCNARILEEDLSGKPLNFNTQKYYTCTFTVETPYSMYGEYEITVEAEDLSGEIGKMDESEYWFFNPEVMLDVSGGLVFDTGRPGTSIYSGTVTLENNVDPDSGVLLDMFISGTDFYDSSNSGAKCPTTNQLELSRFNYYAVNGAYSTREDAQLGRTCDTEGYCSINYGIGFNDPNPFYNSHEIIQAQQQGPYWAANILSPGSEITLEFRADIPEPCNGDFDQGGIYFWAQAI